jgi:hypothetical protein
MKDAGVQNEVVKEEATREIPKHADVVDNSMISFTSQYWGSRLSSLMPVYDPAPNPIALLRTVNKKQWSNFLVCTILILHFMAIILLFGPIDTVPDCILRLDLGCF